MCTRKRKTLEGSNRGEKEETVTGKAQGGRRRRDEKKAGVIGGVFIREYL